MRRRSLIVAICIRSSICARGWRIAESGAAFLLFGPTPRRVRICVQCNLASRTSNRTICLNNVTESVIFPQNPSKLTISRKRWKNGIGKTWNSALSPISSSLNTSRSQLLQWNLGRYANSHHLRTISLNGLKTKTGTKNNWILSSQLSKAANTRTNSRHFVPPSIIRVHSARKTRRTRRVTLWWGRLMKG